MARKTSGQHAAQLEAQKRGQEHAQLILKQTNANRKWAALCESKDERIRLDALKYLTDRAYGKAVQPNTHKNESDEPFKVTYVSSEVDGDQG